MRVDAPQRMVGVGWSVRTGVCSVCQRRMLWNAYNHPLLPSQWHGIAANL